MNTTVKNPYVGPRTFQKEDGAFFYGREREARDLLALIASERLILFYAQSGAGKSSLVNTRVIPELEQGDFEVLPVGRVLGDLPDGNKIENVYAFNLMNSILQQKTEPGLLASKTISEFLVGLDVNDNGYYFDATRTLGVNQDLRWRRVLIIDQFEEIFTTHLDAWLKHGDFFQQVAQALHDDPYLTVIFIMRDDYIASLDLYAHLLPGGLRTRYYMQRLTREAALKAVKNPVEKIRPFADGIAEKLVEDLSGILVHKAGGIPEVQSGQYVEPVQLQVVCFSLWQNLPPKGTQITAADLLEVGDVNQSLEVFYNSRVASVAKEKNFPERQIREWFDGELITANKTRNMILQEKDSSAGLSNDVIRALQGDLVRGELRAGQIWYELSHDRLIEPVKTSNRKWFEQNLSKFQRRVVLWTQQDQSENLLLGEKELDETEQEASALKLTKDEQDFLESSRKQIKRNQRDARQRRLIFIGFIVSLVLLALAGYATLYANQQRKVALDAQGQAEQSANKALESEKLAIESAQKAEIEAQKALAGDLAAQADALKESDHALSLLLSMEAYQRRPDLLTRTALFQLLQYTPYKRFFGFDGAVSDIAVSPDGKWIAVASANRLSIMDAQTHLVVVQYEQGLGTINSLAFNPDGTLLAAAGCAPEGCSFAGGQITLWNVANLQQLELLSDTRIGHMAQVQALAFSSDGNYLATGSYDHTIILWDASKPEGLQSIGNSLKTAENTELITSLAFSPDGRTLVSGNDSGLIYLWDVSNPASAVLAADPVRAHSNAVFGLVFSPSDNGKFASASDDDTIILWDWDPNAGFISQSATLTGHTGFVRSVAFNTDGSVLASAGFDNRVILWDPQTGEQMGPALIQHTKPVNALVFGVADSEGILYSGSSDRTMIRWDLSTHYPLSQPLSDAAIPEGSEQHIVQEGLQASIDGQEIIIQNTSSESLSLLGHAGLINTLDLAPQKISGRLLLVSSSDDQSAILWDVTSIAEANVFLRLDEFDNPVHSAFFGEDGKQVITIETDGSITRWMINPEDWLKLACEVVDRNLTPDEWKQYFLPEMTYTKTCENIP